MVELIGGAEGNRTPDLCSAIAALSHLSYGPEQWDLGNQRAKPDGSRPKIVEFMVRISALSRNGGARPQHRSRSIPRLRREGSGVRRGAGPLAARRRSGYTSSRDLQSTQGFGAR